MTTVLTSPTLAQAIGPQRGTALIVKQVALVAIGVAFLIACAKIRVPMWPVPVTMQTFGVLTIGAVYGMRLGLATLLAYVLLGAMGVAVFAGDSAGIAYLAGPTAGYLAGFAVAAALVGWLSARGASRTVAGMVGALLVGNVAIYAFGLPWMAYLFAADKGMGWVMQWGMTNFLTGDALKLMLAALIVPALWKLSGKKA